MGRYYYGKKTEADSLKKVEISWLKKHGYLEENWWKTGGIKWTNGWSGQESSIGFDVDLTHTETRHIKLHYTQTNNETGVKNNLKHDYPLTTTKCNFGGHRYWFICSVYKNGQYCGKRVGTLYKDGDYFACRHSNELTYESKN